MPLRGEKQSRTFLIFAPFCPHHNVAIPSERTKLRNDDGFSPGLPVGISDCLQQMPTIGQAIRNSPCDGSTLEYLTPLLQRDRRCDHEARPFITCSEDFEKQPRFKF